MQPAVISAAKPAAATNVDMEKGEQQTKVVAHGRTWMPVSAKTAYIGINLCAAGILAAAILGTVWFCQNKHPKDDDSQGHYRRKVGIILMAVFWPLFACGCCGNIAYAKKE